MPRMSLLSSPMLLGFDEIERLVDRVAKGGADGYPPYNIERIAKGETSAETLRITLEDNQLSIRGKQEDDRAREYLHRGIAARQFQRTFVLAEGIEVRNADLNNGLLSIDLVRHTPERLIRRIEIGRKSAG